MTSQPFGTDSTFPSTFVVSKSTTLQMTDMLNGNNKFYLIELHDGSSKFRVFTCYGRTGTPGVKEERICSSQSQAEKEFASIKKSKEKKGYKEVSLASTSRGTAEGNSLVLSDDVKKDNITVDSSSGIPIAKEISSLVERLYQEAGDGCRGTLNGSLRASAVNPLGTLTLSQIDEGKQILQSVNKLLVKDSSLIDGSDPEILKLTNEFYSTVPQQIPVRPRDDAGRSRWLKQYALNSQTTLDKQFELLDLYADVQGLISGFSSTDVSKKYQELNAEFEFVYPNTPEFQTIKASVLDTQSNNHYWKLAVKNIWKVSVQAQKVNNHRQTLSTVGNVRTLFHGSGPQNILGICKKGLLLRPPGVYVTGSMFGNGLYFASESTKSSQYSWGRYSGGTQSSSYFMFVVDVALGNIKKYDTAQSHLCKPPTGYDSVQGQKGKQLVHDEYIIYNIQQQEIQYLIEFTKV